MSWKIEKIINRHWSITSRLTWTYTFSAFFILITTALTLYWIFTSRLEKENYKFLINNVLILQKALQNKQNRNEEFLREEIVLEPAIYHYYVRVIDDSGHIILETPGMSENVPTAPFSQIIPKTTDHFPAVYWKSERKHHRTKYYLLLNAQVNQEDNQYIQIAKDISYERDIIIDYRRDLSIVLLIGVIFTAIIGALVTRKGLKPLRDITESTQKISISRLKERLNPESWPSELSTLATALNNMLDRIEEGFTRISHFSGDLAHELRTPITNLMGEAEIILSRQRTTTEYREVIESSLEELERLSSMIDNLLFLARAENPKTVLSYSLLEMKNVMENICDFYEAIAEEKNIKIYSYGSIIIKADALMLNRAINNIVSNALKHTPPGGLITLKTWRNDQQSCCISISDNGEGIPPEHLPHLFDRFYRVDSARSQSTGGTGLGLAIVRFIMDLHRGDVQIHSQPGAGTTVTLIFPDDSVDFTF